MILDYHHYNVNQLNQILTDIPFIKTSKKISYANIPASFDIETTSFYRNKNNPKKIILKPDEDEIDKWEKCGCEYCFVIGINGKVIFGRTWKDALILFHKISDYYGLSKEKRLIIYVHNLSFEFQWIKDLFQWESVFALDDRKPCYCLSSLGIEFRCSYILTGYSLEKVGEHLHKYHVNKLVGDLDYSLFRHPATTMTDKEIQYVVNDALVVMAHIQEEIERLGDITKLPLTKTGYIRKRLKNACLYEGSHKHNVMKFLKYKSRMNSLKISPKEYKQLKRTFCGGFTHANANYVQDVCKDVTSYDFTSSYPAVIVMEKFPLDDGRIVKVKSKEEFEKYINLYCCVFDVQFIGLKSRDDVMDHYISRSHCYMCENEENDNGRIVSADMIVTSITNVDYKIIRRCYEWKDMKINNFRIYHKGYLPTDFVKEVLDLYGMKTTLKGVEGKEIEYNHAKEDVNSCYGMMVTDIAKPTITYEKHEWIKKNDDDLEKLLKKYNESKQRFCCFQWGIFITSFARYNLFSGIIECGDDYIYSDTDSIKILNADRHLDYINRYNAMIERKLKKAMAFHKLPFEIVKPKTIEGKEKMIGLWNFDGFYKRFKTLGAKRYFIEDEDGNHSITMSGVNKKNVIPYLEDLAKKKKCDIFDLFDEDLFIPAEHTGKMIHTYIDDAMDGGFTDYLGVYGEYHEKSCVHLESASYDLSLSNEFINYLMKVRES